MMTTIQDYAGDISVIAAWEMLQTLDNVVLVDVRTEQEWNETGMPDPSVIGKPLVMLSWRKLPAMQINGEFVDEIKRKISDKNTAILLLCQAGVRSQEAAITLTKHGYTRCYNLVGGFENPIKGWKANTLPWRN